MSLSNETKNKINKFAEEQKQNYLKGDEVRDDMIIYMSDYINDLISQGMSEKEAFEKAKIETAAFSESKDNNDLKAKIEEYYKNKSPAAYESEGLIYGGFTTVGLVTGGLIGYAAGGGRIEFLNGGWIDMLIGIGCGIVLGAGIAMIANAIIISIKRAMDKFN
ncbi:MAG: hypothetical protein FWF92_07030 [Oscillospiraceae bacterium]|nr:hypothetical protein [Oscillospiraceae bacterium]